MMNPWLGVLVMLAALGLWMAVLRLFQSLARPHPEVVRKLMHVGMGLTVLAFPWLFEDIWPVLLVIALSLGLLAAVRLASGLRAHLGSVLGGVARKSLGEFYFAVSVAVLFVLSRGRPYENLLFRPYLRPELVLIAEKENRPVGFMLTVPDLLQARRGQAIDTVILKTVAVDPEQAGGGLGTLLVAHCQDEASRLGYRRAIHALMYEANNSRRISSHTARAIRRYTLFARSLEARP